MSRVVDVETAAISGALVAPIARVAGPARVLSVKQPHASRLERGIKTIEFRTWTCAHRGDLLIAASGNFASEARKMATAHPEPKGVLVSRVNLADVRAPTIADIDAGCAHDSLAREIEEQIAGNRDPKKNPIWSWVIEDARSVERVSYKGGLNLRSFTPDAYVEAHNCSFALVGCNTARARTWLASNANDPTWITQPEGAGSLDDRLVVELDYLGDLLLGMRKAGLSV